MTIAGRMFGASLAAIAWAAGASAQERLEDRIAALEAMVAELKAELAAEKGRQQEDVVRIETALAARNEAAAPAPKTDGFLVGDTTLKFGGFIDLDVHVSEFGGGNLASTNIGRDFHVPSTIPIGGPSTTSVDFTAKSSRLSFTATKPVGDKSITGYFEMDFLGSAQGNEVFGNSYSPRLRRAYLTYGNWLVGQEWSTFKNTSAFPESASFLVLTDGMHFMLQPQIRYTHGPWQVSIENPNTPTANDGLRDENTLPDAVVRYNFKGDWGNVSLSALLRQLRDDRGATSAETFGYGLSASGLVKVGQRDDIRFNVFGGEGVGRYAGLGLIRGAFLTPAGDLEAIPSYGGYLAWRHPFGKTARVNLGWSGQWADNPNAMSGTLTRSAQSAYVAVLWDPAPKLTVGAELLHGLREEESGRDGDLSRVTFSTRYSF